MIDSKVEFKKWAKENTRKTFTIEEDIHVKGWDKDIIQHTYLGRFGLVTSVPDLLAELKKIEEDL